MLKKFHSVMNDMDKKEILSKGFSFILLRLGGVLAGYIFTYLIAREFGASVNGLVSLGFTLIMCISVFGRLGIDVNLIPFYSNKENRLDSGLFFNVLLISFLFSSILSIILFLFKESIAIQLFKKPQLEAYIKWLSLTIPFWTITLICGGLFRSFKRSNLFAFFNNTGRFLFSSIILVVFLLLTNDTLSAIKAHFIGVVLLAFIAVILAFRQFDKVQFNWSKNSSIRFLKKALPMMLSGAIIIFLGWSDTFVLGIYETDSTIGIYNVALKIATLTSFSLQAVNAILAPKIASYHSIGDTKKFNSVIKFSTHLNFYITVIVVASIVLFHKFVLSIFGSEFLAGSNILIVLCVGQLINSFSGSVGLILQMVGLQKVYQNIVFTSLIINIVLNFMLTPTYGAMGAAVATVISISFWNIFGAIYLKRKLNIVSYITLVKTRTYENRIQK